VYRQDRSIFDGLTPYVVKHHTEPLNETVRTVKR